MTGPEHYAAAEELIGRAIPPGQDYIPAPTLALLALGHAVLAAAAAIALNAELPERFAWMKAAGQPGRTLR